MSHITTATQAIQYLSKTLDKQTPIQQEQSRNAIHRYYKQSMNLDADHAQYAIELATLVKANQPTRKDRKARR